MTFVFPKVTSAVQIAVETILERSTTRLDALGRRERTKAAMVLECVQNGYAQAKITNVAKRAKVSTASIYRDFGDRDTLLLQSLELAIGIFALNWVQEPNEQEPVKRLEALLLAHGNALNDPFMAWIFRLYIYLANSSAPQLIAFGRAARDSNLAFWHSEIANLEFSGHLVATDHATTAAILLGAIERRTILSRLAFGEDDDHAPDLESVAQHAAHSLFQIYGTRAFWSWRVDQPAPGWLGDRPANDGALQVRPSVLMDLPSKRLTAFANRILARDVNRLDSEGRKVRIQLAAMMECAEFGYEAATMAGVAARAGVSTATFYNEYCDKRALFIDAIVLQTRFHLDYESFIDPDADRQSSLAALVFSLARVLGDPDFLWFHQVSMASEISDAPLLIESSRATRTHSETFWLDYLAGFEGGESVPKRDRVLNMNMLLGATQRRSVLSMVFFGADDVVDDELARLALASTEFVLRLSARPAYHHGFVAAHHESEIGEPAHSASRRRVPAVVCAGNAAGS